MIVEPIAEILAAEGIELDFTEFSIYGFPGFTMSRLYQGETTVYEANKQEFIFAVSTVDCDLNDITENDSFTISDGVYLHSFRLDNNPINDLTGWSQLSAVWTGKENV